jgi:hypothetical protein
MSRKFHENNKKNAISHFITLSYKKAFPTFSMHSLMKLEIVSIEVNFNKGMEVRA